LDWRAVNRAHWDELVEVHIGPRGYDLADLRNGRGKLDAMVEAELPPVSGKRVLHLQCYFGRDTLALAQRGAEVVGLDFWAPAIAVAGQLSQELGLKTRAHFVQADLYDAPKAISEPQRFDLVFVTWGAICWLPDIQRWAELVASFIKPGDRSIWQKAIRRPWCSIVALVHRMADRGIMSRTSSMAL
jgi:SAM-dependent methyltransferase